MLEVFFKGFGLSFLVQRSGAECFFPAAPVDIYTTSTSSCPTPGNANDDEDDDDDNTNGQAPASPHHTALWCPS